MAEAENRGLIISIASTKGGPGKSTVTANLAVEIARQGSSVMVVDGDPQRTCAKFFERRDDLIESGRDLPEVQCIEKLGRIKKVLLEQSKHYDVVIADTAGRDSQEMRSSFYAADIILIPVEASQFDIETLDEKMIDILDETLEGNEDRIVRTLINKAPTSINSKEALEAKEYVKEEYGEQLKPLRQTLKFRVAYQKSVRDGLSVIEWKDSKAKAEVQCLAKEIEKLTSSLGEA